jgi:hypothetical protein
MLDAGGKGGWSDQSAATGSSATEHLHGLSSSVAAAFLATNRNITSLGYNALQRPEQAS